LRLGPAPQAVAGARDEDEHPDQAERQALAMISISGTSGASTGLTKANP